MTVMLTGGESRKVLRGVRWEEYLALLANREDTPGRFTFDRGVLEIMTTSFRHENLKGLLARLIGVLALELDLDVEFSGSLTLLRSDLEKGAEPDESYYISHASAVRGKRDVILPGDPPPDLVVEVEITRSSIPKRPLYAALGVPELWRHNGQRLEMSGLGKDGSYSQTSESRVFPGLTIAVLERFLSDRQTRSQTEIAAAFRDWVRANLRPASK